MLSGGNSSDSVIRILKWSLDRNLDFIWQSWILRTGADYGQIFTVRKSTVWYLPIIHLRIFRHAFWQEIMMLTDVFWESILQIGKWIDFQIAVWQGKACSSLSSSNIQLQIIEKGERESLKPRFDSKAIVCFIFFSKKWRKKMFLRSADKMSGASCQYSTEIGVQSFKSFLFSFLLFFLLMSFTTRPPIYLPKI